jgi:hypothetical protein
MCMSCLLLDKSLPSPRALLNSKTELNINDQHFEELFHKVMDRLPEEDQNEYLQELINESYLDHIRGK